MSFTDAIQQHCIHRLLSIALVLISSTAISDAAASPLPRTEDNTRNITPFTPGTLTRSFSSILERKGRDRVHVKGKDCNNNKTGYPIPTANNGTLGPDQRLTGASNVQDTSKYTSQVVCLETAHRPSPVTARLAPARLHDVQ